MSLPQFDVTGQKILCVGAGRGIGKGIALAFAEAGADVAVTGLTVNWANQVAEEIRAMGRKSLAMAGDATKAGDMELVTQKTLAEFGHIDRPHRYVG